MLSLKESEKVMLSYMKDDMAQLIRIAQGRGFYISEASFFEVNGSVHVDAIVKVSREHPSYYMTVHMHFYKDEGFADLRTYVHCSEPGHLACSEYTLRKYYNEAPVLITAEAPFADRAPVEWPFGALAAIWLVWDWFFKHEPVRTAVPGVAVEEMEAGWIV